MYLNATEVAAFLRMSKRNIYLLTQLKKIPHFKIGKRIVFDREEIDGWMQTKKVKLEKEG